MLPLSAALLFGALLGATGANIFAISGGSTRFADVAPGSYYDQAVGELFEAGIVKGYPDGTFGPGKNVSRADLAVMLKRLRDELKGNVPSATPSTPLTGTAGAVRFTIGTFSVRENIASITLSVIRTGGNRGAVSVDYSFSGGTATSGDDYVAGGGTLNFADGETSTTFTITIKNDTTAEGNETLNLALSSPTGGLTLGTPSTAVLTILDDETSSSSSSSSSSSVQSSSANAFVFSAYAYEAAENGGTVTITVNRTGSTSGGVSVNYATSNGTAVAGTDYTATSGTLNFATGESAKTFTIPLTDETNVDGNKTVNLALSSPTGGVPLGTPSTAVLTIADNEIATFGAGSYKFSSANFRVSEGDGSVTVFVQRVGGTVGSADIRYATSNGTASAGSDYIATSGTLTFLPGESKKAFKVPILSDTLPDAEETVNLTLSNPTAGATLGTPSNAVITIYQ
jgi:hypothetical protein